MRIDVLPYNPAWPRQFQQLRGQIQGVLGDVRIEHIGSTSVPGLAAKPVIDIAVGVAKEADLDETITPLCQAGFIYYHVFTPDWPERRLFVGLQEDIPAGRYPSVFVDPDTIPHAAIARDRRCHVHVWVLGSSDWTRHLAFRDYLRTHTAKAREYGDLKLALSRQDWDHGMAYNQGKHAFMKATEAEALAWCTGLPD